LRAAPPAATEPIMRSTDQLVIVIGAVVLIALVVIFAYVF
jgi:hypothetical protein